MSHAADVLRRDTSGYSIQLTMLQARALADLVERADTALPCLRPSFPSCIEERAEWPSLTLDWALCPNCAARRAVEAAFEAEP